MTWAGLITMSEQEIDRAEWMLRIRERRTTQARVAEYLGVTVRQVRACKAGGAAALVSKKRGRPSARRIPAAHRARVLTLVRAHYADFGPTLAREKLAELHGVQVSLEVLRLWMIADGLWATRAARRTRPHPSRHRRPCVGELVQIDGCDHEWFEDRGPRCTLLVFVDDATSRLMQLRFGEVESTFDYFEAARGYLATHGRPVAFYSDKAGVFRVNAKEPKGGDGTTQFARAMSELNIDILCANSPQAKGRVERAHQTLRDRLVKELRLRGISTMAAANAFAEEYMSSYNARFAQPPASHQNAHRPLRPRDNLDEVLRWKEQRRLTNNLALHYKRMLFVVEETPAALAARGQLVDVHETIDGTVHVSHRGRELKATPFRKAGEVRQQDVADSKHLGRILEVVRQAQIAADEQKFAGRGTKREKALIESSLERRRAPPIALPSSTSAPSTAGDARAPISSPARPPAPAAGTPDAAIASLVQRLQTDEWKAEISRVTKSRRRAP